MAKLCLECVKKNIGVLEIGDTVVEVEKCSNCKGEEEKRECQFCKEKDVVFDGIDEAGHHNYYCKNCGEPQND